MTRRALIAALVVRCCLVCLAAGDAPRIVSCAPAATETIFDLGGQECLVGRSSACLYPAAATNLPSVGAYSAPSIERIVSLAPTHVVMTYLSDPSMSNRLERLGIRVLQFPCERLADYAPMRARLAALCGIRPRRMLAVVQREPMIVAGKETLPDDVLAEVGCANAVTNRKGYFVLSPEARVKLAADGEVDFSMDYDLTRLGPKLAGAIDELRRQLVATGVGKRQECRFPEGGSPFGEAALSPLHVEGCHVGEAALSPLRVEGFHVGEAALSPLHVEGCHVGEAALSPLHATNDALFWLRVWRVLAGLLVGASLALAGAVLQTVLRNPLADPFVLGLSGGASLAAAAVLATGLAAVGAFVLPVASFAGAVAALLVVAAVARAAGGGPVTLILSGVVMGGITSSFLMLILTFSESRALQSVTWWMMGNLSSAEPAQLAVTGACAGVAAVVLLAQARRLNALVLGADYARTLGVRTERVVPLVLGAASLATAAAVSLAGVIGFVGLIVPHAVRRLAGANHRALLPLSAVGGGIFLVACDQAGRLFGEVEVPAGVITALAGGPFFLYLLIRHARNQK